MAAAKEANISSVTKSLDMVIKTGITEKDISSHKRGRDLIEYPEGNNRITEERMGKDTNQSRSIWRIPKILGLMTPLETPRQ